MKDVKDMESKKEYAAPQMQVVTLDVQGALLQESTPEGGDVEFE